MYPFQFLSSSLNHFSQFCHSYFQTFISKEIFACCTLYKRHHVHPLGADQHLQHRDDQLSKRGGNDCDSRLDACLHILRLLCLSRVGFHCHRRICLIIIIMMFPLTRYAYLLWKKKKSCLKRKKNKKQSEDEGKLRVARKEDYRSKVYLEVEQSIKMKTIITLMKMIAMVVINDINDDENNDDGARVAVRQFSSPCNPLILQYFFCPKLFQQHHH